MLKRLEIVSDNSALLVRKKISRRDFYVSLFSPITFGVKFWVRLIDVFVSWLVESFGE